MSHYRTHQGGKGDPKANRQGAGCGNFITGNSGPNNFNLCGETMRLRDYFEYEVYLSETTEAERETLTFNKWRDQW